ncbi:unnamed protein product, partial [Rotaria sp. Silwood2]
SFTSIAVAVVSFSDGWVIVVSFSGVPVAVVSFTSIGVAVVSFSDGSVTVVSFSGVPVA